jgi:hypothetical protein
VRAQVDPQKLLPWAAVAACGAWMIAFAVRVPPGDGDLLWQNWLGERILREHAIPRALGSETFAAQGAPWTPHEWLLSLLLAWSGNHGVPWFVGVLCGCAATAALTFVAVRCERRGVPSTYAAVAVIVCALAMLQSFGARAQVFGWAGLSALLFVVETGGPRVWLAVPLTALWANLHASATIAPVVAGLAGARAQVVAACALAALATPLGIDLPRYAVGMMLSPIRASIEEWGSSSIAYPSFLLGAVPLVLALVAYGVRTSARDRVVTLFFLVLGLTAVRNVPLFALAVAPIAMAALPVRRRAGSIRLAWTTLGALALATIVTTALVWERAPAAARGLPYASAHALVATRTAPRIFCEDFAWCSIFLSDGRTRFLMDGRADPYPPALWRDYRAVLDGRPGWDGVLGRYGIDAVLARRDSALDGLLRENPAWRRAGEDRFARAYLKN